MDKEVHNGQLKIKKSGCDYDFIKNPNYQPPSPPPLPPPPPPPSPSTPLPPLRLLRYASPSLKCGKFRKKQRRWRLTEEVQIQAPSLHL